MTNSASALGRLFGGASVAALSLAVLLPASALAQEATSTNSGGAPAAGANELQTVVVTGSRIARRDLQSNSPIVTLSSQQLVQQADLQIQNTLNKLPQFNPDQNLMGANVGDVQPTPTRSIGISTASLRGLGANRNLVLIDGRRGAPVNASLVVDLNTIPTMMVDRIETITGGASATYGADAIGGVVNFILKKNFHGVDFDAQYGFNQRGDGRQYSISTMFGTNFADDKGNITIELERFNNDITYQRNRAFYTKGWADPTVAGNGFFGFGTGYSAANQQTTFPGGPRVESGPPSQAVVDAMFSGANDRGVKASVPNTSTFFFTGNTAFTGLSGSPAGTYRFPGPYNGTSYALQSTIDAGNGNLPAQQIKTNATNIYVQAPLDRWSFFTNGHYDFSDWLTATFDTTFVRTHSDTLLAAPISVIDGWTVFIPYDSATNGAASGHPVPGDLATLLNSRPTVNYCTSGSTLSGANAGKTCGAANTNTLATTNAALNNTVASNNNAPWDLFWTPNINGPLPGRGLEVNNQVFQMTFGLNGRLPGNNDFTKDWTWNAFGTHSESSQYSVARGDFSLARLRAMLLQQNWAKGATVQGNLTQAVNTTSTGQLTGSEPTSRPGFGSAVVHCTSGFYDTLFNNAPLSADCFSAIQAPLQSMNITKQDQVEFDFQGSLFKLPAGDVKFAAGADYRRDSLIYNPDILQSYSTFLDQVIGVYPTEYLNVSTDVKEGYGELDIPVLAGLPLIKKFTINPGARYSTYSASKGGWTYKIMGDLEVNDYIRLRGGFNLAVRAPNLGELFQGATQLFGGSLNNGDPCSLLSTSPYGAGGANGLIPLGQTKASTVTNTGGAAAAANAYAICRALMGPTGADQYYDNPATPPGPPAPGATFLNQRGNRNLEPEIAHTYTAGIVLRSPFQQWEWARRATVSVDYYKIHLDKAIEYTSADFVYQNCLTLPAATALSSSSCQAIQRAADGSVLLTDTPQANLATVDTSGVDVTIDWSLPLSEIRKSIPGVFSLNVVTSFLGNYDTNAGPGQPTLKWYGSSGPTLSGFNGGAFSYRLNTTFGYAVGPANLALSWRHLPQVNAAGQVTSPTVASLIGGTNHTKPTSAYDSFDLSTFWNLPHGLQLRAGIQNLLDSEPPITGATYPTLSNTGVVTAIASTGAGSTNSSYYDVMGRRFFIGLKARF